MRIHQACVLGLLMAAMVGGCRDRDSRTSSNRTAETKRIDEIQESPLRYLGRDVTVIGTVDNVFDGGAFELESDGVIWPKKLLVLTRTPVRFGPTRLAADEELAVKGVVRRMSPDEIDRAVGYRVDRDLTERYRDQPVLVADSLRLLETQATWSKSYQQGAIVSAIRLLSAIDPAVFVGHDVDLANVPVRATTNKGLWVGFGPHSELFLVSLHEAQLAGIAAGDHLSIRGVVREMRTSTTAPEQTRLEQARARGEKVYIEASDITKLTPRPST